MSYRKIKPINEEQHLKSKRCKKNVDRMYRIESERSKNLRKKQSQIKKNAKTNTKENIIDKNSQRREISEFYKGLLYTHGDKSYFGIPVETKWFFGTRLTKSSKRKITDFIRMNAKFFHSEYKQGFIYEFIHKLFKYKNYLHERKDFLSHQTSKDIKYGFIRNAYSNKNGYLFLVNLANIDTRNFTISLKSADFDYVIIEDFDMNIYNRIPIESPYKMPNHAKIHIKNSACLSDKLYIYYKTKQNIPDGVKRDTFNFAYTNIDMK